MAYYSPREKAQWEWDNAAPPGPGPRNALTYRVADAILVDMRNWYEARLEGEDVSAAWKHLHQCLFKRVTVPLDADMWRNPNRGAAHKTPAKHTPKGVEPERAVSLNSPPEMETWFVSRVMLKISMLLCVGRRCTDKRLTMRL